MILSITVWLITNLGFGSNIMKVLYFDGMYFSFYKVKIRKDATSVVDVVVAQIGVHIELVRIVVGEIVRRQSPPNGGANNQIHFTV